MLGEAHFSAGVSAADRDALLAPLAAHVSSLPEPDDHLPAARVSGAALLTVTGNLLYETAIRQNDPGAVKTAGYRLDDEATVVALDSQPAGDSGAGRKTVWHFRFRSGGSVEIVGEVSGDGSADGAESFARRLASRVGRRVG